MSLALLLSIRNPPPQVGINKGVTVTQSGTTRMRRCNTGPPFTASGDGELSAGARVFGNRPSLITPFVGEMTHKGTLGSTARDIPLPHPTLIGNGRRGLARLRLPARSRGPRARLPHSNRGAGHWGWRTPPPPLCDIPSGGCSFTGPWTVTRSPLRMLRRVAAFCRPLRPVLLLVSFPRSRSPVVGVLGLCWMWHGVPFACQQRPIIGVLGVVLVVAGVV